MRDYTEADGKWHCDDGYEVIASNFGEDKQFGPFSTLAEANEVYQSQDAAGAEVTVLYRGEVFKSNSLTH